MIEKELYQKLNEFQGFNPDMLYNDLIILKKKSDFNEDEYNKFIVGFSLLHQKNPDYQTYQELIKNIYKLEDNQINKLKSNLKKAFPDWIGIERTNVKEEKNILKLYLSIDNKDIHFFANQLIAVSLKKEYHDLDFKLNNNDTINRRDNIVIYCNKKNIKNYLELTEELIEENPQLEFNPPHLLGIPYNKNIYCGIDPNDGKTSYTEKICENIYQELENNKDKQEIITTVEKMKAQGKKTINALISEQEAKTY